MKVGGRALRREHDRWAGVPPTNGQVHVLPLLAEAEPVATPEAGREAQPMFGVKAQPSRDEDANLSIRTVAPPSHPDDAELVAGLTRRERDPMATIYEQYARTVFDFARCTLVQRALAEDVVQEVFLELWNHPERFDPTRGSLRAYLLTIAHGRSVDVVRSESTRRRREDRDGLRAVTTTEAVEDTQADADQVRGALAALSPEQREAIGLAYFLGYTYREVAARLGVPEGTIKNRIRKGLERLRVELAGTEAG